MLVARNPFAVLLLMGVISGLLWFMLGSNNTSVSDHGRVSSKDGTLTEVQVDRIRTWVEDWPSRPDYLDHFNALNPGRKVASAVATQFDPTDDYWGLPRDVDGTFELVDAFCAGCHSLNIVMQQNADREGWRTMIDWMEEKQGMAPLPAEFEGQILDYLSENF